MGRLGWLDDEMESWRKEILHSLSQERWRRVSGNSGLDARTLAIVRELFHWRDAEARRRNQPARRVLRDDLIVEIARRGSADVKHIQAVRGMERGDLQRRMGELAAAVQRAWICRTPNVPSGLRASACPELSVLGQFLFAALGSISREAQLAPNLVGTPSDIREWMAYRSAKSRDSTTIRRNWPADGGRSSSAGSLKTCWTESSRSASTIRLPIIRWRSSRSSSSIPAAEAASACA